MKIGWHTGIALGLALVSATVGFGLVDLLSPAILHEGTQVSDVGYGTLAGIVIPVGLLAAARSSAAGLRQVVAAAVAYAVIGLWCGSRSFVVAGVLVGATASALRFAHPDRAPLFAFGRWPSARLVALVAAGSIPGSQYVLHMAANQHNGLLAADSHLGLGHWAALSAAGLAVLLVAALTALRNDGSRLHGFTASGAVAVWALACLAYPNSDGAVDGIWAGLALAWAAAFCLVTLHTTTKGQP